MVYAIKVKNDGTTKAKNVVVTIPMPATTAFDKCTILKDEVGAVSTPCTPGLVGTGVTVNLGNIKAHKEPRVNLTLVMPAVTATTTVTVSDIKANGDDVTDSDKSRRPPPSFRPAPYLSPFCLPGASVRSRAASRSRRISSGRHQRQARRGARLYVRAIWTQDHGERKTIDLNKFNILWEASPRSATWASSSAMPPA